MLSVSPFHAVLAILVAAGSAAALAVAARRRTTLSPSQRTTLFAARATLFALMVLAALDPAARRARALAVPPRVAVALDASMSMSIRDQRGDPTRWEQATSLLEADAPLAKLLDGCDARFYAFSDRVVPWRHGTDVRPNGAETDIAAALREAIRASGPDVAAVVLVSDGQDSTGAEGDEIALAAGGIPVYAVGIGGQRPPADVEVARLVAPRTIPAGEEGVAIATLYAPGFEGQTLQATFRAGRREVEASFSVQGDGPVRLRFPIKPTEMGLLQCRVFVPVRSGELTGLNNARTTFVRVTQGRRRILWVDRPRQEFAFLRRAVEGLPKTTVDVLLAKGRGTDFWREGERPSRGQRLPTRRQLAAYDAVIIGDVPARRLGTQFMRDLAELVRDAGIGLGVLGGPRAFGVGGYAQTPLAAVLPLSMGRLDGYRPAGFRVRRPVAAIGHPVLDISATAIQVEAPASYKEDGPIEWPRLPYLSGINETRGPKPGAQVLLQAVTPGRPAAPLAAVQRVGAGKAFCLASDSTWRWVLSDVSDEESARAHGVFWRRVFLWLATRSNDRAVRLAVDRQVCPVGQPIRIVADVSGSDFGPIADAEVVAKVRLPSGSERELSLPLVSGATGRYEAALRPQEPGDYLVTATATRRGRRLGEARLQFAAQTEATEFRRPVLNRRLLEDLAACTGGAFIPPDDVGRLPALGRLKPRTVQTFSLSHWTRTWAFLAVAILVAGVDWGLRRRWGAG